MINLVFASALTTEKSKDLEHDSRRECILTTHVIKIKFTDATSCAYYKSELEFYMSNSLYWHFIVGNDSQFKVIWAD